MSSQKSKLNLLLVDDSEDHLFLTKSKLESEDPSLMVIIASSAEGALETLPKLEVDCIVSDYEMSPGMNGLEFFKELRRRGVHKPFIFLTGQGNEELAREAFLNGVDDYFTKDVGFAYFTKLINAVKNSVRKFDTFKDLEYTKSFNNNIVSNMFEGFCVIDDTGRILMWSRQIQKICGIRDEMAIGKYAWEILEVPDGDLKSKLEKSLTGATPVNTFISFQAPTGNIRQLKIPSRIVPFTDELGKILGSIILVIDPSMLPLPKSEETLH